MIRLVGPESTAEYAAGEALRDLIVRDWPGIVDARDQDVRVVCGAKCHGQQTRDIDLLVLANLGPGIEFSSYLPFAVYGQLHSPDRVRAKSLCIVIETKQHPPEGVRFVGTTVEVRYGDRWHGATEQAERALYSVRRYLELQGIPPPRITALVWLRNVPSVQLPGRPHSAIGTPVTWEQILNVVAQLNPPSRRDGEWVLSAAGDHPEAVVQAAEAFTRTVTPTRLDRQRMERVARRTPGMEQVRVNVGQQLSILRGRGGTGKTVRLLQLAHELAVNEGSRVLILTYNRALVADIRRLLTILGISDGIGPSAIHIQTVHSFLFAAFRALGLEPSGDDFLDRYEQLKEDALQYVRGGALSPTDLEGLAKSDAETFRWDYVFVDEGQDWPENEQDLLAALYPRENLVVADGIEQLVRTNKPADWRRGGAGMSKVFPLQTCLRMKTGLARFVSACARHFGLQYLEWEANEELPGGRVVVVDGPYLHDRRLHDDLVQGNSADGNSPVDMLFCVPPSLVTHGPEGTASAAARRFREWGYPVWDGACEDVRETYPTELDQHRIVQYDSCRGLEGWVAVNLALDRLYQYKRETLGALPSAPDGRPLNQDELHVLAARWVLIPLTRAMDTLVVQLDQGASPVRTALERAAAECGESVEWIRTA